MRHATTLPALVAGLLLASPAGAQTCPQTFSGALTGTSPTMANRLFRDGVASTCQTRKASPGPYGVTGTYAYQTFQFTVAGVPRCVTVTTDGTGCGGQMIFGTLYLGSFDPTNLSKNYLADAGASATAIPWTRAFSFVSDPSETYVAMVSVVASGASCPSFGVSVDDCQAGMVVSPARGSFGPATVGVASNKTFTVYNNGTGTLNVTGVTIAGTNAADFATPGLPALPAAIPASGTLALTVAFTPGAAGARSGTLTVSGDDAAHPSQTIALSGVGTWLKAVPNPLAFAPVTVGEVAPAASVTFTNTSTTDTRSVSALTIGGANAADFSLAPAPTLPATLTPGAALAIPVAFAPAAPGSRAATLDIASDDPNVPTFSVALTGSGATATPEVTPSLDFGNQNVNKASPPKDITVKNNGLAAMIIHAAAVEGTDAAMFQMALPSALPISIDPGAAVSVPVTFKPTKTGAKSANASFTIGGVAAPVAVPLTGKGTQSGGCGCGGGPASGAALLAALLGPVLLRRRRR